VGGLLWNCAGAPLLQAFGDGGVGAFFGRTGYAGAYGVEIDIAHGYEDGLFIE
jgi:hypothetical protein